jgi:hypothetical protein
MHMGDPCALIPERGKEVSMKKKATKAKKAPKKAKK